MSKTAIAVLLFGASILYAGPAPRTRSFAFEYNASVENIPQGTKQVDLWIPVPHDDAYQTITSVAVESPVPYTIDQATDGNRILHIRVTHPEKTAYSVLLRFDALRREHVTPSIDSDPPADLAHWLQPARLVPINSQIRTWAEQVVTKAHAHTDLEMARAIYNNILSTMTYDKSGEGWGRGDIYYACSRRRGNCSDFHAVLIGYCHALGIPAKFEIGFPLPAERGQGNIEGYHCWAEFYAKGIGWVPIDASEASKHPEKREYFFGHHDENRIQFSEGRDIMLAPKQQGPPLNFFIYPYAQIDGKPYAGTRYSADYRDRIPVRSAMSSN
jgi:transglutaminase-like putative cysteine protease